MLGYMLAWLPVLTLLGLVAKAAGGLPWGQEFAVLTPACVVFAFACLSPWYVCRALPLGHGPTPEEIADAVLFLAAARSVTGQTIAVDGGQRLGAGRQGRGRAPAGAAAVQLP